MAQIIDKSYTRTHVFDIVEDFPPGYIVWNIGRQNFKYECYIPLAQRVSEDKKSYQYYHIQRDTLKAIKVDNEALALHILNIASKHSVDCREFYNIVNTYEE